MHHKSKQVLGPKNGLPGLVRTRPRPQPQSLPHRGGLAGVHQALDARIAEVRPQTADNFPDLRLPFFGNRAVGQRLGLKLIQNPCNCDCFRQPHASFALEHVLVTLLKQMLHQKFWNGKLPRFDPSSGSRVSSGSTGLRACPLESRLRMMLAGSDRGVLRLDQTRPQLSKLLVSVGITQRREHRLSRGIHSSLLLLNGLHKNLRVAHLLLRNHPEPLCLLAVGGGWGVIGYAVVKDQHKVLPKRVQGLVRISPNVRPHRGEVHRMGDQLSVVRNSEAGLHGVAKPLVVVLLLHFSENLVERPDQPPLRLIPPVYMGPSVEAVC
eukprot:RCo014563